MNPLKKIINNCKKATLLLEKRQAERLTVREHFELHIHLTGCSLCRLYGRQSKVINLMVQQLFHSSINQDIRLDENFKRELHHRIEGELNKN